MHLQLTHQIQKQIHMLDLLLAILISMGMNVTPQDMSNKDFLLKNQTAIQQAQNILLQNQSETAHPSIKRNTKSVVMKK
jgi:hypothetical protein